jgi:hypothetical protein
MADIIEHPKQGYPCKEIFPFKDGSELTISGPNRAPVSVRDAVYMCEEVKLQLMEMLRNFKDGE